MTGIRESELDALARAWLPHLYLWCHRLGGPWIEAEDVAHEVLIVVCRRIDELESTAVFPAWLFGVCRRTVANHRRGARRRRWELGAVPDSVASGPSPEGVAASREVASSVWRALDQLPAVQREVLVLCGLEDRSGSEAAELLGIPHGTVKSRMRSAVRSFREAMGGSSSGRGDRRGRRRSA